MSRTRKSKSPTPTSLGESFCTICLEKFDVSKDKRPRGHLEHPCHRACLNKWFGIVKQKKCPTCKLNMRRNVLEVPAYHAHDDMMPVPALTARIRKCINKYRNVSRRNIKAVERYKKLIRQNASKRAISRASKTMKELEDLTAKIYESCDDFAMQLEDNVKAGRASEEEANELFGMLDENIYDLEDNTPRLMKALRIDERNEDTISPAASLGRWTPPSPV